MEFTVTNPYTCRTVKADSAAAVVEKIRPEFARALNHRGYTELVTERNGRTYYAILNTKGKHMTGACIIPNRTLQNRCPRYLRGESCRGLCCN